MRFGITVLPDPPYTRFVELMQLAEQHGFEYGWTYDSHLLWQEPYPFLTAAALATESIKLGLCVTNPGTREPTVTASATATLQDISLGPHGRRHRPRRLGPSHDRLRARSPMAEFERSAAMIKELMNGREVEWNGKELQLPWAKEQPEIPLYLAGYGPKALAVAGRQSDGVIVQLADPDIIEWIMGQARAAAVEAGRDPAALEAIVCAPVRDRRRPRRGARPGALVPRDGLEPRLRPAAALRRVAPARAAHVVPRAARVLRLLRAQPHGRGARRVRRRRDVRPLLHPRLGRGSHREAARARGDRRHAVEHLPHDREPRGDARAVRHARSSRSCARRGSRHELRRVARDRRPARARRSDRRPGRRPPALLDGRVGGGARVPARAARRAARRRSTSTRPATSGPCSRASGPRRSSSARTSTRCRTAAGSTARSA